MKAISHHKQHLHTLQIHCGMESFHLKDWSLTDFKLLTRFGIDATTIRVLSRRDSRLVDIIPASLSYFSVSFFNLNLCDLDSVLLQIPEMANLKVKYAPDFQTIKLAFQRHQFLPENRSTLQRLREMCKTNGVKIIEEWYSMESFPFSAFIKEFE